MSLQPDFMKKSQRSDRNAWLCYFLEVVIKFTFVSFLIDDFGGKCFAFLYPAFVFCKMGYNTVLHC